MSSGRVSSPSCWSLDRSDLARSGSDRREEYVRLSWLIPWDLRRSVSDLDLADGLRSSSSSLDLSLRRLLLLLVVVSSFCLARILASRASDEVSLTSRCFFLRSRSPSDDLCFFFFFLSDLRSSSDILLFGLCCLLLWAGDGY